LNMFFKVYLNHLLKNPLAYFDKNSKTLPNLGEHLLKTLKICNTGKETKGNPDNLGKPLLKTLKILVDETDLKKGLNVVIVYSGGDDLFLVGSWNHCLAASLLIREAFRAYTLDTLTFSGGFEVFNPHMPLKALAERVGESEDKAKAFGKDEKGNPMKDALCLFSNPKPKKKKDAEGEDLKPVEYYEQYQDTHQWCGLLNELHEALPLLTEGKENDYNTSGFIYQLYQLGEEVLENKVLPVARLHYLFERQLEACGGNKDRKEQLKDLKRKLLDENLDIEKTQENFKSYKTPFFIATYLHRTQ
jgi:CRISPR-associated protein Csm1